MVHPGLKARECFLGRGFRPLSKRMKKEAEVDHE